MFRLEVSHLQALTTFFVTQTLCPLWAKRLCNVNWITSTPWCLHSEHYSFLSIVSHVLLSFYLFHFLQNFFFGPSYTPFCSFLTPSFFPALLTFSCAIRSSVSPRTRTGSTNATYLHCFTWLWKSRPQTDIKTSCWFSLTGINNTQKRKCSQLYLRQIVAALTPRTQFKQLYQ